MEGREGFEGGEGKAWSSWRGGWRCSWVGMLRYCRGLGCFGSSVEGEEDEEGGHSPFTFCFLFFAFCFLVPRKLYVRPITSRFRMPVVPSQMIQ